MHAPCPRHQALAQSQALTSDPATRNMSVSTVSVWSLDKKLHCTAASPGLSPQSPGCDTQGHEQKIAHRTAQDVLMPKAELFTHVDQVCRSYPSSEDLGHDTKKCLWLTRAFRFNRVDAQPQTQTQNQLEPQTNNLSLNLWFMQEW